MTPVTAKSSNKGRPRGKYYGKKLHHSKHDTRGILVAHAYVSRWRVVGAYYA